MAKDGALVFLGFDGRYAGNSRALFEQISADARFVHHPKLFVSDDVRVPSSIRISPDDTSQVHAALKKAAVVFLESWVPPTLPKTGNALWIQLWHGTPLKRVLFDSHEPYITSNNQHHKVQKYRNIQRWDFLLSDSDLATEKFTTAFLYPRERIIQAGYPRVSALVERRNDPTAGVNIRRELGISSSQHVVLYAPTWRDRNYGVAAGEMDLSYLLSPSELVEALGPRYVVVTHEHDYMESDMEASHSRCIDASGSDIQDLLLVADAVVSDYSSVVFDCFAAGIPVALYVSDLDEFEAERGLYHDAWQHLTELCADDLTGVVERILNPPAVQFDSSFKSRLTYSPKVDLLAFLDGLDIHRVGRDW